MSDLPSYEELLKKGLKKVPKEAEAKERFEIPKAQILRAGQKTIITNFTEIASHLRREQNHVLKFLLKELATSGELSGPRLTVIGSFSEDAVNSKIDKYAKAYVFCTECKKPDTKLVKEGEYMIMKCEACGARHPVPKV
ncbi:MAG: translation initiation factor IF-2 subunit beta [Candidatus Aenigmarchaeota archaeon]|nr:translation initiation factor IF-2 subunit beta [Candidatus Aenigmarchaeota archaeon]